MDSESGLYNNVRSLIDLIDDLRDIGLHQYINLPRICVVGTQSSGKSSVLESIVGIDFLPRGEGVVTRRPIEFRLVHLSPDSDAQAYAVFDNDSQKFYDFNKVREHIIKLTNKDAGEKCGIIDSPIVLSIYSPNCPDLTLIDLPGITRVPIKNSDQTDDIEKLTRDMATKYAADHRTLILAVLAANVDMSTSDALQLARRVDPQGLRTLGVITKIDLMDRGVDASHMLLNDDVPLRLGYTGVKNRSQKDINDGVTIAEALQREKEFFENHSVYKNLKPSLFGIPSLVNKLTDVLFLHIKHLIPDIHNELIAKTKSVSDKLAAIGENVPETEAEQVQLLWTLIDDYCGIFSSTIKGKYTPRLHTMFETEVAVGSQIRGIFNELLEDYVNKPITHELSNTDIDQAIRLHEGDSLPGFPSLDTFEFLMLPYLKKIAPNVFSCLDKINSTLITLSNNISNRVFSRFPALGSEVLNISLDIFKREFDVTSGILNDFITAETTYLFTNDPTYLLDNARVMCGNASDNEDNATNSRDPQQRTITDRASHVVNAAQQKITKAWDSLEKTRYSPAFIKEIRRRLDSYFEIVLRNVRDSVPKIIGHFLVRKILENMQFEIYSSLNKQPKLALLLGESPYIFKERTALKSQLEIMKKAIGLLQRDGTFTNPNNLDLSVTMEMSSLLKAMYVKGKASYHRNDSGSSRYEPSRETVNEPARESRATDSSVYTSKATNLHPDRNYSSRFDRKEYMKQGFQNNNSVTNSLFDH